MGGHRRAEEKSRHSQGRVKPEQAVFIDSVKLVMLGSPWVGEIWVMSVQVCTNIGGSSYWGEQRDENSS